MSPSSDNSSENWVWFLIALATLVWLSVIGWHYWWRSILLAGLTFSSFAFGGVVAFLFTSYGEESGTIGKVRDWVIGAITGLTIAKASSLKVILLLFSADSSKSNEFALTLSTAIFYTAAGFFFMFLKRELIFNILLAQKRAERGRIEGAKQAGAVTLELISAIPSSVLAGIEDIGNLLKNRTSEARKLEESLYSEQVTKFLEDSQKAVSTGIPLDWDIVSKVAYLHYYRAYFEKTDKLEQQRLAHEWIIRALFINPTHIDLTIKAADVLGNVERFDEAVATLETISRSPDCPFFVEQWLGFYLVHVRGRESESIELSRRYLHRFPNSSETLRNLACAYAQLACKDQESLSAADCTKSDSYNLAISFLKAALQSDPSRKELMRTTWIEPNGSFHCFSEDPQVRSILGLD